MDALNDEITPRYYTIGSRVRPRSAGEPYRTPSWSERVCHVVGRGTYFHVRVDFFS